MSLNRFNFRAWSLTRRVMCGADFACRILSCLSLGQKYISDGTDSKDNLMDVDCFILMQSAGLLDMNGVEIFDGDTVSVMENSRYFVSGVIVWDSGVFRVQTNDGILRHYVWAWHQSIRVTGNIYQHPHLLKEF